MSDRAPYECPLRSWMLRNIHEQKGEKSNKYFLGLESHRGTKSCIRKLISSDGNPTTNPLKIMKEIEKFYFDLC